MEKRVAFFTLGCRVNQYESYKLAEEFKAAGWLVVPEEEIADAYIVNTCTVTRLADRKSRQYIRRMKRLNPNSTLIVMGCYSETNPEEVKAIAEVDYMLGSNDKEKVFEILGVQRPASCKILAFDPESRTRAMIQIQTGCNRFCSYCVIPYARNKISSKPIEEIVSEAKDLIVAGYKEIVLTGINTALYEGGVEPVIKALNSLPGDFRIRFGSLEPTVVDAEYVKGLFKYEKLCHHFHLSVQSGSDKIIKAMNRSYSSVEYLGIVKACRDFDPLFGITTDIIAGFPGETEEDLNDSLNLIKKAGFLHVHAFPYSKRLFTKAAQMDGQIPPAVKKARNKQLIEAGEIASQKFRKEMIGSIQRVLVEKNIDGLYHGHASNYTDVYFTSSKDDIMTCQGPHDALFLDKSLKQVSDKPTPDIINTFVDVEITDIYKDGVLGKEK